MITPKTDQLEKLLVSFMASMRWRAEVTEYEKTLVIGNLNGFVAHLRANGYAEIFEMAIYAAQKYDGPTMLVEVVKKFDSTEIPRTGCSDCNGRGVTLPHRHPAYIAGYAWAENPTRGGCPYERGTDDFAMWQMGMEDARSIALATEREVTK